MMTKPSPIPRGRSAGAQQSDLYHICFENLPMHRKAIDYKKAATWHGLDIRKIAKDIGVAPQKVSVWMKQNRMPGQRVKAMIDLSGSTLNYEKLGPFINTR